MQLLQTPAPLDPVTMNQQQPGPRNHSAPAWNWFDALEVHCVSLFSSVWHRCGATGAEVLPRHGPAILVANHPNHSDPAFLIHACRWPLRFLHAQESFNTPVLHRLFSHAGSVPVRRRGQDTGAVRAALRLLEQGQILCIFPQGEVDGVGPPNEHGKHGAAYLALKSHAPVYPVAIVGGPRSHSVLRDWFEPSGGVQVVIGPAIDLTMYCGERIRRDILEEVTHRITQRIDELVAESLDVRVE